MVCIGNLGLMDQQSGQELAVGIGDGDGPTHCGLVADGVGSLPPGKDP
jgi:hypothetical protein